MKHYKTSFSRSVTWYVLWASLNVRRSLFAVCPHPCPFVKQCIVMGFAPGFDLDYIIKTQGKPLTEDVACRVFQQLLLAVKFLHDSGFVNRDLRTTNIIFDERTSTIKLQDFMCVVFFLRGERVVLGACLLFQHVLPSCCLVVASSVCLAVWLSVCLFVCLFVCLTLVFSLSLTVSHWLVRLLHRYSRYAFVATRAFANRTVF